MSDQVSTNEILEFLKENMFTKEEALGTFATKDDLQRFASREDLVEFRTDIMTTVDRFAKLHETLDQELVMLRSKYNRLEERLEIVETRLGIAA